MIVQAIDWLIDWMNCNASSQWFIDWLICLFAYLKDEWRSSNPGGKSRPWIPWNIGICSQNICCLSWRRRTTGWRWFFSRITLEFTPPNWWRNGFSRKASLLPGGQQNPPIYPPSKMPGASWKRLSERCGSRKGKILFRLFKNCGKSSSLRNYALGCSMPFLVEFTVCWRQMDRALKIRRVD